MALKPWYDVIKPREDLREGRPLDASEFAVHLDHVREKRAPSVYQNPAEFFERTYLTKPLLELASQIIRRLNGIKTETSAVFNMATQFGGGKTHALTLAYHLAREGQAAAEWKGVDRILRAAQIDTIPKSAVAVFVGTEFDSITGRGGDDGTPLRKTPWGEIAYQLGREEAFAHVAEHDAKGIAPGGDVIRKFLPKDRPSLILVDELINYLSRYRRQGLSTQVYDFLHDLSETVRSEDSNAVLAVSIPASELEMTPEDQSDHERFKKMLDRLGKAIMMSAEEETSEIIRRRLFEWNGLAQEAKQTALEYAEWIRANGKQVPGWFDVDQAIRSFEETYPFHPSALSVFSRKWQTLPRFQRTRGVLRLLALWVSNAYKQGYEKAHKDPLITLGTAPLDDPQFRAAMFEQLGEDRLEGPVTTDICGSKGAHAMRLDSEATPSIKKARLHRKAATTIFFESNGGQGDEKREATAAEIRLAVSDPSTAISDVETVLEALGNSCYYLRTENNKYRFGLHPNLNKLLADKRANVKTEEILEKINKQIIKEFPKIAHVDPIYFPKTSSAIPNIPALTLAILPPEQSVRESDTLKLVQKMTLEYGNTNRTFKSGIIWVVPDAPDRLYEEARRLLAWQLIQDDESELQLDDTQTKQLAENVRKAERDLRDATWQAYHYVMLLGKDNAIHQTDLGMTHTSQGQNMTAVVIENLRKRDEVSKDYNARGLVKNWPGMTEWSTRAVRDAFYASPLFPRLLDPEAVKDTILRGVAAGIIAYVGKSAGGEYKPFCFEEEMNPFDIEISEDMFILTGEHAEKLKKPPFLATLVLTPQHVGLKPGLKQAFTIKGLDQNSRDFAITDAQWNATGGTIDSSGIYTAGGDEGNFTVKVTVGEVSSTAQIAIVKEGKPEPPRPPQPSHKITQLTWSGEIPAQKWSNFYMKVLSRFATKKGLKLTLTMQVSDENGISDSKVEETKTALRELGVNEDLNTK